MNTSATSTSTPSSFSRAVSLAATYTFPFTTALILITNIINICVFSHRTLRSCSCTHYLIASATGTLLYLTTAPFNLWATNAFGLNPYNNPFGCRVSPYLVYSSPVFITSMIACASSDRYCSSSSSVRLRAFCQLRIARRVIIIIGALVVIYLSPMLIVYQWHSDTYTCVQISTPSIAAYLLSRIILYYILLPMAMTIFGVLTIYNIRAHTHRIAPINRLNNNRRTEVQLARMLIIQVVVYLIFSTPSGVLYVLVNIVPSTNTPFFSSLRLVTILWQQGSFFWATFIYAISGFMYRQEIIKMFKLNRNRDQTQPSNLTQNPTRRRQTDMTVGAR